VRSDSAKFKSELGAQPWKTGHRLNRVSPRTHEVLLLGDWRKLTGLFIVLLGWGVAASNWDLPELHRLMAYHHFEQ